MNSPEFYAGCSPALQVSQADYVAAI
jgi:hypothetical protein